MKIQIIVLVLCLFNYALAVSKCWSCADDKCNDPFNSSNAAVMDCTNLNSYRSLAGDQSGNGVDVLYNKYTTLYSSASDYVCAKYVVNSNLQSNYTFTMRLCSLRTINGQNTCDVISNIVGSTIGPVTSCKTCETDLCNSATRWSFSVLVTMVFGLFGYLLR